MTIINDQGLTFSDHLVHLEDHILSHVRELGSHMTLVHNQTYHVGIRVRYVNS